MKKIGVLTSGGDAPGMNACIRAIVRSAAPKKIEIIGIRRGFAGLIDGDMITLGAMRVANILDRGGTFLDTSRCESMKTQEGMTRAIENLAKEEIEGLITIGGDGTFRGAAGIAKNSDVKVIGIPGTIDNDIYGTDYTIGFDTAVNTALQAIDKIRDTAESLEMLFFIEVMGRTRGFIALSVGIAGGANEILIPEVDTDLDALHRRLRKFTRSGKGSAMVVVAEGDMPGGAHAIAGHVGKKMKLEYRVVSLGHVQRGGSPTARDRILASMLGIAAVNALLEGKHNRMVGEIGSKIVLTPLSQTWSNPKELDNRLLDMLHVLHP